MLKQIKMLGLGLLVACTMMFTGCNSLNKLQATLTPLEQEYYTISEELEAQESKINIDKFTPLQDRLVEMEEELIVLKSTYTEESTEYKMICELINAVKCNIELTEAYEKFARIEDTEVDSFIGMLDAVANGMDAVAEGEGLKKEADEAIEQYELYKEELGIEIPKLESTKPEEQPKQEVKEEQSKEEPKQEVKEEQPKQEPKQEVAKDMCGDCGKTFLVTELEYEGDYARCSYCQVFGQCYDCGEDAKKANMTFDGRCYHCGCKCAECDAIDGHYVECSQFQGALEEPTILCSGCDMYFYESEMAEDPNGKLYCLDCYGPIMNEIMGGPANGDLEEWEY